MHDKRLKCVLDLVPEGKRVLVAGCEGDPVLHAKLVEKSEAVTGIDIDPEKVKVLSSRGYDGRLMNAEQMELEDKYDCIVAVELIEHLDNVGLFLRSAARVLQPGGLLVLTTPNMSSVFLSFLVILCNQAQDVTHVYYFDRKNLRALLSRCPEFVIEDIQYVAPTVKALGPGKIRSFFFLMATMVANAGFVLSKRLFGSYLVAVLRRKS
jgi:SAM-dependent methyltransferase